MAEEQTGFFSRWASRKTDVLQGKAVPESAVPATPVMPQPVVTEAQLPSDAHTEALKAPEPLSLEDVKSLTKDSDFKPFMARGVGADVRNAAMKKLFADPHFNVMDGLDIYIDDYSKSDPIPEAMLRAMTSSKFLNLFGDEEKEVREDGQEEAIPRETANDSLDQNVAQSHGGTVGVEDSPAPPINQSPPDLLTDSVASQPNHDHSYLRLQPDDAAPEPRARRGIE